jgi:uncharacterized protein
LLRLSLQVLITRTSSLVAFHSIRQPLSSFNSVEQFATLISYFCYTNMQNIIITGGTGLVGNALTAQLLQLGYGVHIFTRSVLNKKNTDRLKYFAWDTQKQSFDVEALNNAIAIVNLAGEGVADKRWSVKRKEAILQSRIQSGALVCKMLLQHKHNITTLIQASATGWYGPNATTNSDFQETSPAHNDYLGQTCQAWEQSIATVLSSNIRVVTLRIGIVLSSKGGMVKELAKPMQLGVIPVFGNGQQIVPWIHITDLTTIITTAITNANYSGIYNAVASNNTTQKSLAIQIAKALGKKTIIRFPISAFLLKIILGEMSIEVLKSAVIENDKIKKAGYTFQYPALESIKEVYFL